MKKIFIFLMAMPFIMALNSCDSDNTDGEEPDKEPDITWGEIQGDLNDIWYIAGDPQCVATSDNYLAKILLPTLIDMLNTISEAQAYSFNADKSYSQYWISDQPDDPLYEEKGTYELNDRDLTITYTDGQTDEIKTATYKIVSLSDTQLVLYKEILGIWGSLAVAIVEPFDKLGITPKSVYKIITYTNVLEEEGTEKE